MASRIAKRWPWICRLRAGSDHSPRRLTQISARKLRGAKYASAQSDSPRCGKYSSSSAAKCYREEPKSNRRLRLRGPSDVRRLIPLSGSRRQRTLGGKCPALDEVSAAGLHRDDDPAGLGSDDVIQPGGVIGVSDTCKAMQR